MRISISSFSLLSGFWCHGVRENEPFDVALRRFKRSCEKAGILADVRAREFYEKPTTVRKRAKASAIKRHAKKMARENARRTRLY